MSNAPVFSWAFKGPCKRIYNIKQQTVACNMSLRHARSFSAMCSVARLFLRVAYVGSLLKERDIHSLQGACSFAWLISDLYLKNEAYTVCRALVPSRGICRIFA